MASDSCSSADVLDRYILAKTRHMIEAIQARLDAFDIPGAYEQANPFIEALNNWYIRNRRSRFWSSDNAADKQAAYDTLFACLTMACRGLAPPMPLIADKIYTSLTSETSVHVADWPDVTGLPEAPDLMRQMDLAREACSAVLTLREETRRRVRLPLGKLIVAHPNSAILSDYVAIIAEQVNVKTVELTTDVAAHGSRELRVDPLLGKVHGQKMKVVFAAQRLGDWRMRADGKVEIGGILLEPGQFNMRIKTNEGVAAQPFDQGRGVVVLDIAVTRELQAEGWARDVVRLIQNARKGAGLNLTDRINVAIQAHGPLRAAIQQHSNTILNETLAIHLDIDSELPKDADDVTNDTLDGNDIRLTIARRCSDLE